MFYKLQQRTMQKKIDEALLGRYVDILGDWDESRSGLC